MAAKSDFLSSDISTPSECGPCLTENKTSEATMFCVECNDMLCDTCVGIHEKFPTMKNHRIVVQTDKEQFEFAARLLSDKCEKHDAKCLETFCKIHDELCCSVCVSLSHRMCDGLVYIPEFANEKTTQDTLKSKIQTVEQMKLNFESVKGQRHLDKLRIGKEKEESMKRLDDYRNELVAEIGRIHCICTAELKSRYDSNVKLVEEDMETCNDNIAELKRVLKSLDDTKDDTVRSFIGTRRVKNLIHPAEVKLDTLLGEVGKESMVYIVEPSLKHKIKKVNHFGQYEQKTRKDFFQRKRESASYKLKVGSVINEFEIPRERFGCSIQGIEIFNNGQFIISDYCNKNLKLYDQNMGRVRIISLQDSPRDICTIDDNICISYKNDHRVEIATLTRTPMESKHTNRLHKECRGIDDVICISYQQFHRVEIATLSRTSLETKHTFEIGKECRGVCYKNGELFVACGERNSAEVRVYSTEGQLKRTYDKDVRGNKLFSAPYYVNTNNDGSVVFVCDNKMGVFALRLDGSLVWKYNDQKVLMGVWDVAVDENDNLYVCGFGSNNIVKICSNGLKARVVIDGIKNPTALCLDSLNEKLLVVSSENFTDSLQMYQIIKERVDG